MKFFRGMIIILAIMLMVGCSTGEANRVEPTEVVTEDSLGLEEDANNVIVNEDGSVTFKDSVGDEITMTPDKERVVSLYTSNAALWVNAGGKLVGIIKTENSDNELPEAAKGPEVAIVSTTSSGKKMSVEKIAEVNPDLILLGHAMSQADLKGSFENMGIQTVVVEYEGIDNYLKWFKVFSNLNGRPELYDEIAKPALEGSLEVIGRVPKENNPTAALLFPGSDLKLNTGESSVGEMFKQLGGKNVVDGWDGAGESVRIDMSLEGLIKEDPDMIIVSYFSINGDPKEYMESVFAENPAWGTLTAVKEGKVYYLSKDLFQYRPAERYPEAYLEMASYMYPEVFK